MANRKGETDCGHSSPGNEKWKEKAFHLLTKTKIKV